MKELLSALSESAVRELDIPPTGSRVHFIARGVKVEGKELPRGLGVRCASGGVKAFTFDYRDAAGKKRRETIGRWPTWSCVAAARRARELRQALDRGEAIGKAKVAAEHAEKGTSVADMLDAFMKHEGRELRTAGEYQRIFDRYVKPAIGELGIYELKRSHIAAMLDDIRDGGLKSLAGSTRGPAPIMANRVRSRLSAALNWYADERDDEFTSPLIIRRRRGTKRKEPTRDRWLNDAELCVLWQALDGSEEGERLPSIYPAFVKLLLMTACRRSEISGMHERELSIAQAGNVHGAAKGQWLFEIPAQRYKSGVAHVVPLSRQAVAELKALGAKPGGKRYVLSTDGGATPFSGYSKAKGALDMRMARVCWGAKKPEVPNWTLHDLRRSARTMLSAIQVEHEIAERVLGHKVGSAVAGRYNQYAYLNEKLQALQKLADEIDRAVAPVMW